MRSYGEEMFYHLIVPEWVRWLLEPAPLIVTPREGFEPSTAKDGGGALPTGVERWGDHLITRVSATPNVTLVHDFMTSEECAFVRALGRKMGMVSGTRFPVTNGKVDASAAGLYDYVYGLVRTSVGEYVDYKSLDADDLRRMVAIAKKVEAVTGLAVGNSELPFVQRYEPSARFRAHYGERAFRLAFPLDVGSPNVKSPNVIQFPGRLSRLTPSVHFRPSLSRADMYNVDVTKPFPYRDNPRSLTLLAYLNDVGDGGGGETEFMLATPRPVRVKAAQGAALIWGNCELEDVAPVEIGSGFKVNPDAGGGAVLSGTRGGAWGVRDRTARWPTRRGRCRVSVRSGRAAWIGRARVCTSRGPCGWDTRSGR